MKLIEQPKKSLYEVDIEFMIGDADGEEHYIVPMYNLEQVKELVKELDKYLNETSWNQKCDPKPLVLFETYPAFMKYLTSNYSVEHEEEKLSLEQFQKYWGEIYWPRDYNYDRYLHMMGYEIYSNIEDKRYKVKFEEGDI